MVIIYANGNVECTVKEYIMIEMTKRSSKIEPVSQIESTKEIKSAELVEGKSNKNNFQWGKKFAKIKQFMEDNDVEFSPAFKSIIGYYPYREYKINFEKWLKDKESNLKKINKDNSYMQQINSYVEAVAQATNNCIYCGEKTKSNQHDLCEECEKKYNAQKEARWK